jgi:PLD-like domain
MTIWQSSKPLPPGLHVAGAPTNIEPEQLRLLTDLTASDAFGQPVVSQQIFDATLGLVSEACQFLVMDYFLFNAHRGPLSAPDGRLKPQSQILRDALLARRRAVPEMPILLLVDPINSSYGTTLSNDLQKLRDAGIAVVPVALDTLRDPNALYSAAWRLGFRWWLTPSTRGTFATPLDEGGPPVSVGALLRLLNLKADHRKLVIAGDCRGALRGIISSANPHDASSAHSNLGLQLSGPTLKPLLDSEVAVARSAGWQGALPTSLQSTGNPPAKPDTQAAEAQVLTEGAIRDALLQRFNAAAAGTAIDIAMFYIADRDIVRALRAAAERGARVRLILDPNKDAFGHEKSGLPNRQVAAELVSASHGAIRVRWYRTHGEQFHTKLVTVRQNDRLWFTLGSANLTRRNLEDYNLEANVAVELSQRTAISQELDQWFETLWSNRAVGGIEYTADVDLYADASQGRYWLYRIMEATGISTF